MLSERIAPDCKLNNVLLEFKLAPVTAFHELHQGSMFQGCYFNFTRKCVGNFGNLY